MSNCGDKKVNMKKRLNAFGQRLIRFRKRLTTKALRMQRQYEVHAKAPRRKGRSESQGILLYFAPLVRQAKLDVSYQLKGTDHGNYSFAM